MKNNRILSLGTMYLDINCINFPFEKGLSIHKETIGSQYELELGGSALNFAKIATSLGVTMSFLGKTGIDPIGNLLISLLQQSSIKPIVIRDKTVQTNLAIHYVHKDGTSIMSSCGNANQSFTITEIEKQIASLSSKIDYLYLGGVFKLKSILYTIEKLLIKLKNQNVKIILDHGRVNNQVIKDDIEALQKLFPYIDIYLPSIDEFLAVWDSNSTTEGFSKLHRIAQPLTVIKQSKNGVIGYHKNEILSVDAYKVDPINTVGAGDSFNAGFIKAYIDGMNFKDCLRFGCATAAIKISTLGDFKLSQIEKLLKKG